MKKTLAIIFTFSSLVTMAQVGVNNTNPQEELHITGTTSTIRIEGLNAVNNPLNLGVNENTRVYANSNGDLVLNSVPANIEVLFNPANYLEDALTNGVDGNVVAQTGTGSGYSYAGQPRQSGPGLSTFTLIRPAIVEINYSITYELDKAGDPIDDFHARTAQFFTYLRSGGPAGAIVATDYDGNPINFGGNPGALGYSGNFYTNGSSTGASGLPAEGYGRKFYATGHDYVKLGPGTYTPMFAGILFVADTSGTGQVSMQVGGGDDEVIVIAHYYN